MEEQTIGGILRKIRIARDLTQTDLADMLGVGVTYISRVERGYQTLAPARLKILREKANLNDSERQNLDKILAESGCNGDESEGLKEKAIERQEMVQSYQDLRLSATYREVFPFSTELIASCGKNDKAQKLQWFEQIFIPTVKARVAVLYLAEETWVAEHTCFVESKENSRLLSNDQIELPRSIYQLLMPLRSLVNIQALEEQGIQCVGAWPLQGIYFQEKREILGRFIAGFDRFQHLSHVPYLPLFTRMFCNAVGAFLQTWRWSRSWSNAFCRELQTTSAQIQKWAEQLGPKENAIPAASLQELCKILAYALDVEHVSCWLADAEWQTIRCLARSSYPPILPYTVQFSLSSSDPSMTRYIAQAPALYAFKSEELLRHPAKRIPSLANEGLLNGLCHGLMAVPLFAFASNGGLVYRGYLKFENPGSSSSPQSRFFTDQEIQKMAWFGLVVAEALWTRPSFLGKEEVML